MSSGSSFRRVVPETMVHEPQGGGRWRAGDREVPAAIIFHGVRPPARPRDGRARQGLCGRSQIQVSSHILARQSAYGIVCPVQIGKK
ncbi:hypothetical protein FNV64_06605 [Streptomyces sp. S1A1-7]|nr:hypothetical protein FNV64_06605 [Streptomyces sp. S1A1-7]